MSALHLLEICDAVDSDAWHVDCHYVEEKRANVFLMLPDRPGYGRWMKAEGGGQQANLYEISSLSRKSAPSSEPDLEPIEARYSTQALQHQESQKTLKIHRLTLCHRSIQSLPCLSPTCKAKLLTFALSCIGLEPGGLACTAREEI